MLNKSNIDEFEENAEQVANVLSKKDELNERDTIILHNVLACAAAEDIDANIVLVTHGGERQWSHFFEDNVSSRNEQYEYFARSAVEDIRNKISELMGKADVVVANSEYVKSSMKRNYDVDSVVIYPPIDTETFQPDPSLETEDFFLSVQRMEWYKRVDAQIEAFSQLDENLKIVGAGEYENSVEREVRKHDNIDYLGYVSDEKLCQLYNQARATIQTSIKEDWGYVPRESIACGTPAIVGYEGGFEEFVDSAPGSVGFNPENRVRGVIEAVQKFDSREYNSQELREYAVDNYSAEVIGKQFEELITNIEDY